MSHLTELDQEINISQLEYDKEKVEILHHDPNDPVVKITHAEMLEVEEEIPEEDLIEGVEATEETAEGEAEGVEEGAKEETKESEKQEEQK